jgi:periplasmic copper chaperone A
MKFLSVFAALFSVAAGTVFAADSVKVYDAWVKDTVPGAMVSAAYLRIKSNAPVKLVKAESPVAGMTEIHKMEMKDGIMKMQAVDAVEVVPGKVVDLKPGGYHIMLMMLKDQIKAGAKVPLTLTFEDAGKKQTVIKVEAKAQGRDAQEPKH